MKKLALLFLLLSTLSHGNTLTNNEKQEYFFYNRMLNGGCESDIDKWTPSAGTLTAPSTGIKGTKACQFVASGASQTVTNTVTLEEGDRGKLFVYKFQYKYSSATNEFTIAIGGDSITPTIVDSDWHEAEISTTTPNAATVDVVVTSSGSDTFLWDDGIVTREMNVGSLGTVSTPWSTTKYIFTFSAGYGTTTNEIHRTRRVGDTLEAEVSFKCGTTVASAGYLQLPAGLLIDTDKFTSATNVQRVGGLDLITATLANIQASTRGIAFYDGSTNNQIFFGQQTGTVANQINKSNVNGLISSNDSLVVRFKVPIAGWSAGGGAVVTNDQAGWYVDANIGATNFDLGTSAQSTYIDMSNSGMDLVKNDGSVSVGIACDAPGTEEQEIGDLTCTGSEGDESNGITFAPPKTGVYKACVLFSHSANATSINNAFQIVETPNNALTISQEGNDRATDRIDGISIHPLRVCGIFTFTTIGQKTLRLYYEQVVTGVTNSSVIADRDGPTGQRDIHWTVRPWIQQTSTVIVDAKYSQIHVYAGVAAYGGSSSGDTTTRNFASTLNDIGECLTLNARTATTAMSFDVECDGKYSIQYGDNLTGSGGQNIGITKNGDGSTSPAAMARANVLRLGVTEGSGDTAQLAWEGKLLSGDTIRAQTEGVNASSAPQIDFIITRTGD